jgi:hypothetical protein
MSKLGRKKAIIYGFVFVAAVVGLVLDRMFYVPSTAKADNLVPDTGNKGPKAANSGEEEISGHQVAAIFKRDQDDTEQEPADDAHNAGQSFRNAFAPSQYMQDYYQSIKNENREGQSKKEKEEKSREQIRKSFKSKHSLQATFIGREDPYAVVDGQVMGIGDKLDDLTLVTIGRYRIVFANNDLRIYLRLPLPFESKVTGNAQR